MNEILVTSPCCSLRHCPRVHEKEKTTLKGGQLLNVTSTFSFYRNVQ